jgi:hypothetical protein
VYPVRAAREKRRGERAAGGHQLERELEIVAGGEKIELNPFTESIVLNTLVGLLGSLRGLNMNAEVRVVVKPKAGRE